MRRSWHVCLGVYPDKRGGSVDYETLPFLEVDFCSLNISFNIYVKVKSYNSDVYVLNGNTGERDREKERERGGESEIDMERVIWGKD